jgi:lysophospholipase L1-like esterase
VAIVDFPVKEYKPVHVLLFTVGVFALLAPLAWLVEDDSFKVADVPVRFISSEQLLHPKEAVKKDITNIVAKVDTTAILEEPKDPGKKHTLSSDGRMGAPSGGELTGESATIIHYDEGGKRALYNFFEKLEAASNGKKKVRILHYGDSQIEGDRMTSYIRQRLQSQFGGNGPGMIPAMNVYNTQTFKQTYSDNFTRYTAFGGAKLKSRRYGSMNTAARFTPEYDSAQMAQITSIKEAFIEIEPSKSAYERAKSYNNVKLYYTSCVRPCAVKIYQNGNLIHEDSLENDGRYHVMPMSFPGNPGKLKYVFSAAVSPTIIGFSLEGDFGVQVDNIGMRGSSGTFFGKIDHSTAAKMYDDLNVEMVIMQFGGNSVPYLKDSSGVRNFARNFKGQLQTLKKLRPSASVMVIGPSDMSTSSANGFVTYRMLPFLVDEMRKAAKDVGACYWDLYRAMGGYNSMPSWVEQGLAGRDYIHFTPKGASIASQLFFDAFAAEYVKWKQGN